MATIEDPLPLPSPPSIRIDHSDVDDADAEVTADESQTPGGVNGSALKKRRRFQKRLKQLSESMPNTPHTGATAGSPMVRRFPNLPRRATMPDSPERGAVSEGEGQQMARPMAARRGHSHFGRSTDAEDAGDNAVRRRSHNRRISMFGVGGGAAAGGGVSDGDAIQTPRRPRFGAERYSTFAAGARWKQVKNTLGLLRHKRGEPIDYFKSTELMGELRAGAPAVVMFASMLQRDEHGHKKIPVLLEQVRVQIADSVVRGDSERHTLFTIHLEYGNGPNRMTWKVKKSLGDILRMHFKYKGSVTTARLKRPGGRVGPKQPKFPSKAFPYLRNIKKLDFSDDDEGPAADVDTVVPIGEDDVGEATAGEMTATDVEGRPGASRRRASRMNILSPRRNTSNFEEGSAAALEAQRDAEDQKRKYAIYQRKALEKYLREMVRWLMFRPDSNRLCRFFELSALGVRLAAEGGYHGKEGFMQLRPTNEFFNQARKILRKDRKWFLVRQSYIACVDSPESIDICDVYLVDSRFDIICKKKKLGQVAAKKAKKANANQGEGERVDDGEDDDFLQDPHSSKKHHHKLTIVNSERKINLYAQQHDLPQFEESIKLMMEKSPWASPKIRFDSFAPVRQNVYAQWLVDGRDYMWNVSRAISMAKDVIYIHDWWLSPELYMRRPPCISQRWRLDRLLQQKASEGVKIFVIVYRNVEAAVPIDSEYTKRSLLNLHPNIFVQRSPNQYKKNQYFFAHHEKVCIVDHNIAFCGGIDLCFGRWDTPQHLLSDDKPTGFEPQEIQNVPRDSEHVQMFPGKDYSNPRIQDFFKLDEPYEEMYDRSKTPRMPWHDISMQVVGQPARDLTRHFVQRWNYLRRNRRITRPLPFLLPPPDFREADLEALGLTGTCEVQILRSATTWSLGTAHTECSIQNAYVQMIEKSDHFVYMENQFFISSCEALGVPIVNKIGDALVDRIKRAHENDEDWKCVILIPLMPGFQNTVAEVEGTSVRLIMQCQYRSICRGDSSIFGRLRAAGIEPEDYIQFFSLRQWGKIGPNQDHVTEQLYIHAKLIIVDDRVALIGSANINERSMLGSRDSEIAAIVRDTDMIWSQMAGKDYQVGRFAHTLRMRLMREHVGLPVDEIIEEERNQTYGQDEAFQSDMDRIYGSDSEGSIRSDRHSEDYLTAGRPDVPRVHSLNYDVDLQLDANAETARRSPPSSSSSSNSSDSPLSVEASLDAEQRREVDGFGADHWNEAQKQGLDQGRDSVVVNGREYLARDIFSEGKGTIEGPAQHQPSASPQPAASESTMETPSNEPLPPLDRRTTEQLGLPRTNLLPDLPLADDTDIGGPPLPKDLDNGPEGLVAHPLAADIKRAKIDKDCMTDPLDPDFYDNVWSRIAKNNTKLYRQVFHCMPDNEVRDWSQYMEFMDHQKRLKEAQEGPRAQQEPNEKAEQTDYSHQAEAEIPKRQATAGGAGISAPGSIPLARTLSEKVKGKGSGTKATLEKTAKKTQAAIELESPARRHARHNSRLDIERAAAAARALNSPMASPAFPPPPNSPFPPAPTEMPSSEKEEASPAPAPSSPPSPPPQDEKSAVDRRLLVPGDKAAPTDKQERRATFSTPEDNSSSEKPPASSGSGGGGGGPSSSTTAVNSTNTTTGPTKRRRRATTRGSRHRPMVEDLLSRDMMDGLCNLIQGHLVEFPYDWLLGAEEKGDWLTLVDQAAPLQIYN
ncbi:hypothetical protein BD289DRAFT_404500 [Coniella lustricola]|uniref:Phospholipase D1 n=1 Tax=Coniella lustricola TaxID=2025994 RepID=A0A2T3AG09_9PEZI|nr:hypothetical protein BD289DRAFT_404500 [Coniella lustricola]